MFMRSQNHTSPNESSGEGSGPGPIGVYTGINNRLVATFEMQVNSQQQLLLSMRCIASNECNDSAFLCPYLRGVSVASGGWRHGDRGVATMELQPCEDGG